jgi:hypothetical protein
VLPSNGYSRFSSERRAQRRTFLNSRISGQPAGPWWGPNLVQPKSSIADIVTAYQARPPIASVGTERVELLTRLLFSCEVPFVPHDQLACKG